MTTIRKKQKFFVAIENLEGTHYPCALLLILFPNSAVHDYMVIRGDACTDTRTHSVCAGIWRTHYLLPESGYWKRRIVTLVETDIIQTKDTCHAQPFPLNPLFFRFCVYNFLIVEFNLRFRTWICCVRRTYAFVRDLLAFFVCWCKNGKKETVFNAVSDYENGQMNDRQIGNPIIPFAARTQRRQCDSPYFNSLIFSKSK